jgi:hypothetical protein
MADRKKKGLAQMTLERRQEIARMGGKAVHAQGKGYKWDSATAKKAAKLSKIARRKKRDTL